FVVTLVGAVALFLWGRSSGQWPWVMAGVVSLVLIDVLAVAISGFDRLQELLSQRWLTWDATLALIREQPWFGIGPGNFSREFPAKVTWEAVPPAAEPHNFLLEVTVTLGLAGLALLLATLVVFFRRVIAGTREPADEETAEMGWMPWEFYMGGVAGLSLGFVL